MGNTMNDTPHSSERRRHLRIILKAYASGCTCLYSKADEPPGRAQLVDISPGGARLRSESPPAERTDILLDCSFLKQADITAPIPSVVRWVTGQDFGIAFTKELPLSTSDLQRIVDS